MQLSEVSAKWLADVIANYAKQWLLGHRTSGEDVFRTASGVQVEARFYPHGVAIQLHEAGSSLSELGWDLRWGVGMAAEYDGIASARCVADFLLWLAEKGWEVEVAVPGGRKRVRMKVEVGDV